MTVGVTGEGFVAAVAEQLRADGFDVRAGRDADVLVLCWPQVASATLAQARALRADGRPLVAVVGEVPSAHLIRALAATLDGVVLLEDVPHALRPTLAAVLAGQTSHPRAFRERLERPLLSAREKQVLAMVVLGLTNGEIAGRLYITEASVKAHLTSSFAKLGVRSRDAAAALILDPDAGYGPGILRITPEA